MKLNLLFFALLLTFFSWTKKEESNKPIKTIISGQIQNFNKNPSYNTLELSIPDVLAQSIQVKKTISKNGQFKFELNLDNATNVWLRYESNFPIFISPGDSIHLNIDNNFISNESENYIELYSYLKVTGASQKLNEEISEFLAFFEDSVYHPWALNDSLKKLEAIPAKEFLERELERHSVELEQFNKLKNTSVHFQEWAENHLKYRTWIILFQYPAFHSFLNQIKKPKDGYYSIIPNEYFSFLDSFENQRNDKPFETKNYTDFLRSYISYINQLIPQDTSKYYRSLYDKDFEKGFNFFADYFSANTEGFLKDLLISNHYYRTLENGHYNDLKYIIDFEQIEDKKLRKNVEEKFYSEQKIYENPTLDPDSKINEKVTTNEFLVLLKEKYKDNVIFIDFWAPWCKPCMAEMTFAQELKKQYETEDIIFVYLGTGCKMENWELTITEKNIKGEHYLLTDNQTKELNDIFDIRGIPHYVLLDKNGNVVNKFAPRPSSGKKLTNLINKYLKQE